MFRFPQDPHSESCQRRSLDVSFIEQSGRSCCLCSPTAASEMPHTQEVQRVSEVLCFHLSEFLSYSLSSMQDMSREFNVFKGMTKNGLFELVHCSGNCRTLDVLESQGP